MSSIGHNSGLAAPELVVQHYAALAKAKAAAKAANTELRKVKKLAADDGIDVPELEAWAKRGAMDPAEIIRRHNVSVHYARALRLPVGSQMTLFDMPQDPDSAEKHEQKWKDAGFNAGMNGKDRSTNPYDPNLDAGRAWLDGYEEAQSVLMLRFTPLKAEDVGVEKSDEDEPSADQPPKVAKKRGRPSKEELERRKAEADAEKAAKAAAAPPPGPISDDDLPLPPVTDAEAAISSFVPPPLEA